MRILLLHNYYQQSGGEDAVVLAERELLAAKGHRVEFLSLDNHAIRGGWGKLAAAASAIYSRASYRLVRRAIRQFQPDMVHVHNFFPLLSPAVYDACDDLGVPVVQTLHNFRLACANSLFFRQGRVCEECLGGLGPWPGIRNACYRDSHLQSAAVAAMIALHRTRATWRERVDAFVTLTAFSRDKLARAGVPLEKLHVKPNFAFDPGTQPERHSQPPFALYVGRLSQEKGVAVLVDAYLQADIRVPLKIVGDGPLREELQAKVRSAGRDGTIAFLGRQDRSAVQAIMGEARLLVSPSVCYEGFPMAIVEAFSGALPVMASRLGGVPEIVEDKRSGWLVEPGDPATWGEALIRALSDLDELRARGLAARGDYERRYTPDINHFRLMEIYEVADRSRRRRNARDCRPTAQSFALDPHPSRSEE